MKKALKVIISGGGTGGHIFPALAIANAIRRRLPDAELLFVGANGRMEMEKVPAAGFRIIGLDIQGMNRKSIWKNLVLPFKMLKSVLRSRSIIKEFKPDIAVGVGGYASGPLLYAASQMGVPYVIQEQNSYAGVTNKWLGKKAKLICVAFENMDRFFPADRIMLTGNPVRKEVVQIVGKRYAGAELLSLSPHKKTILVTGGSLGAGTLNKSMLAGLDKIMAADVQLIWQCGKYYYPQLREQLGSTYDSNVRLLEFLNKMDLAYAAADLIISRAGAGTIAELCLVEKPVILVPSPNVAEDHQTSNAMALVRNQAAMLVTDSTAESSLVDIALTLLNDDKKCESLGENIGRMAFESADEVIAEYVIDIATRK